MDVDEEDEAGQSTQRPRRVPDFGIEVDFDALGEDERKVRAIHSDAIYGRCPRFYHMTVFGIGFLRGNTW
jgi:hypothetical protein